MHGLLRWQGHRALSCLHVRPCFADKAKTALFSEFWAVQIAKASMASHAKQGLAVPCLPIAFGTGLLYGTSMRIARGALA